MILPSVFRPTGASIGVVGLASYIMMFFSLVFLRYASAKILVSGNEKKEVSMEKEIEEGVHIFLSTLLESVWALGIGIMAGHLLT